MNVAGELTGSINQRYSKVEYYFRLKKINEQLDELRKLRSIGLSTIKGVIGESLFKQDLYSISLQDRCIRLNDGFVKMIEIRNLCCAGIILRSQLDNCMRVFAYYRNP